MNDIKNATQNSFLLKILIVFCLIIIIIFSVFYTYKNFKEINQKSPEEVKQEIVNTAAIDASTVPTLSTQQRTEILKKAQETKGVALPKKEAADREAEIMKQLLK